MAILVPIPKRRGWSDAQLKALAESRFRILYVGADFLETVFDGWQNFDGICLPVLKFDTDAKICSVHIDDFNRRIGFRLCSPNFAPVEDGCQIPNFADEPAQWFAMRRVDSVFEIPPEMKAAAENYNYSATQTDTPRPKCGTCGGTGNFPGIEVCGDCRGTGEK